MNKLFFIFILSTLFFHKLKAQEFTGDFSLKSVLGDRTYSKYSNTYTDKFNGIAFSQSFYSKSPFIFNWSLIRFSAENTISLSSSSTFKESYENLMALEIRPQINLISLEDFLQIRTGVGLLFSLNHKKAGVSKGFLTTTPSIETHLYPFIKKNIGVKVGLDFSIPIKIESNNRIEVPLTLWELGITYQIGSSPSLIKK